MNCFNHNIRFIRKKRGEGQAEFAKKINLSRSNVASYEGKSEPSFPVLIEIVNTLDLDLSKFLQHEMNDFNYETFFNSSNTEKTYAEPRIEDRSINARVVTLVQKLKSNSLSEGERSLIVDEISKLVAILSDQLSLSRQENSKIKDELIDLLKDLRQLGNQL